MVLRFVYLTIMTKRITTWFFRNLASISLASRLCSPVAHFLFFYFRSWWVPYIRIFERFRFIFYISLWLFNKYLMINWRFIKWVRILRVSILIIKFKAIFLLLMMLKRQFITKVIYHSINRIFLCFWWIIIPSSNWWINHINF